MTRNSIFYMGEKALNKQGPYFEREHGTVDVDQQVLGAYLRNLRTILGKEEVEAVLELFPIKTYKKGTILLRAGEIARESYYNFKGLVRQYVLINGEERSTFFYTEGHAISSMTSYSKQIPSKHFLSCVEDTTLSVINFEKEKILYERFPRFISMCRESTEEELGNYQDMMATYITSKPEERYQTLLDSRPELLNRVPLYMLASFLGVTPESLSRIRKRIVSKE